MTDRLRVRLRPLAAAALLLAAAPSALAAPSVPAAEGPKDLPLLGDAERLARPLLAVPGKSGAALLGAETVYLPALDEAEALLSVEKRRPAGVKAARAIGILRTLPEIGAPGCLDGAKHVVAAADGTLAWALEIRSTGAHGVRARICAADLPAGAEVVCYDADEPGEIYGPLPIPADVSATSPYYTPTVFGEALRVEVRVPAAKAAESLRFAVDGVTHQFVDLAEDHAHDGEDGFLKAGGCIDSVACDSNYLGSLSRAVGRMLYESNGGSFVCTGQLLNDTDESDFTPWFLTANHCISTASEAASLEVTWDYHKPSCFGTTPSLGSRPRTNGAVVVETVHKNSGPDTSLLRLTGTVPSGRLFAGWSTTAPSNNDTLVAIHHPAGEHMRISYGRVGSKSTNFTRVEWTNGVVLGGSSGSAIYNASRQVVGQLCCGTSSCSNQSGSDDYGRFDRSYSLLSLADHLNDDGGGGGGGGGGDVEPDAFDPADDTRLTATVIGSPPSDSADHGPHTLSAGDREDWFAFDLVKGGTYLFESLSAAPDEDDVKAQLFDRESGRAVAKNDDGGDARQFLLIYRARRTRTHYLRVRHFKPGEEASYTLRHSLSTPLPAPPTALRSKLDRKGRLVLKWSDVNRRENGYLVQEQIGGDWTTLAELRKNSTRAKLPAPSDGPHLYRVGPWNARGAAYTEIAYDAGGTPGGDAADPGDDVPGGATTLSPAGGGQVTGRAVGGNDAEDWFTLDAVEGTTYVFESTSAGDLIADVFLPGDTTTPIASDDDSGEALNFRLLVTAPATGPLLLRVRPFAPTSVVSYSLSWTETGLPTTSDDAQPLVPVSGGTTVQFTLDAEVQELWFVIDAAADRSYTVESVGTGDTFGEIRSPTPADVFASDDDSGAGLNFRLGFSTDAPETVWIRVRAFTPGTTVTFSLQWGEEAAP